MFSMLREALEEYDKGPIGLSNEVDQEIIVPELNHIKAPILPLAPTPPVAPALAPVERPIEYCQVAVTPVGLRFRYLLLEMNSVG